MLTDPIKNDELSSDRLKVKFASCPVSASLGVLGRKWTLLIIRNIALYNKQRFNEMLKVTPGLTPRVLAMRLRELRSEGLIECVDNDENLMIWSLTEKGRDTLPILMCMAMFGSKWFADKVFADKSARSLKEVFDEQYIREILQI